MNKGKYCEVVKIKYVYLLKAIFPEFISLGLNCPKIKFYFKILSFKQFIISKTYLLEIFLCR
jgi:hypothetical protein